MEHPIKIDDLGGPPLFLETPTFIPLWKGLNIDGVLQETSASHLHLGDLRDWGGPASAASDASLTCRSTTSWRHQDVNEEEQGVSLDMVILDLCQHNFSDKYSYKITP